MKKKISILLVVALMISMLSACGHQMGLTVDSQGRVTATMTMYLTDKEMKSVEDDNSGLFDMSEFEVGKAVVNGIQYTTLTTSSPITEDLPLIITPEKFYLKSASADAVDVGDYYEEADIKEILDAISFYDLQVTMPKAIVKTNGTLSDDKKTATWSLLSAGNKAEFYAYTTANPTTNPLSLKVGKAKYIKANKNISISTKDTVSAFAATSGDDNNIVFNAKKKTIKFKKSGKYIFDIWAKTNVKTFTVKVDGDAPVVKGIANKKTYKKNVTIKFSDKLSGIKSATLNGKKIKSGKKVTKNGSYTLRVTDKVGNTKTVKFKVKKK